ncbi:hypothetical protein DPMN_033773 [Dreissena polymorpha]|uniref:Uncharacterized protein n=1 Tax=Dreissena polymorpha TaxID=45954 RepID=A0A9D4RLG4_DREPO|nr:hypothetical protein DPMN_033773 [Dreissena polymorpha]
MNVASRKNVPSPCGHVLQPTTTIFELVQDIIGIHLVTKFRDDRTIYVISRDNVFQPTEIIFKLVQDIIGTNLLTRFHEDRTMNFYYSHIKKNDPTPGGHAFQAIVNIFELVQDIVETNLIWTINVASIVLTRQMLTPHNAQKAHCAQMS